MDRSKKSGKRFSLRKLISCGSSRRRTGSLSSQQPYIPEIPSSVLATHVFSYLDRHTQNSLSEACRDVYLETKNLQLSWPSGRCRVNSLVPAVAFKPFDSSTLAVALKRKIHIWNARKGPYQKLRGHTGTVSDVKYSPDGRVLASASRNDGTIRLWSVKEDQYTCDRVMRTHMFYLRHIKWSPEGSRISLWGLDGFVRLYHLDGGSQQSIIWKSRLEVYGCHETVAFSGDERLLAFAHDNEEVRLWDLSDGTIDLLPQSRDVSGSYAGMYITSVAYSPDNKYLVVGCHVAKIKFWSTENYSYVRSIHVGSGWSAVTLITFTSDSEHIACSNNGSQIRLIRVEDEAALDKFDEGHTARIESLSLSHDNETLVSAGLDRSVRIWNLRKPDQFEP